MDLGPIGPGIPHGICGVYLLEVKNISYYKIDGRLIRHEGKRGYRIDFTVLPYGDDHKDEGKEISDVFWLGTGVWRLTNLLKYFGTNRKQTIDCSTLIGKKVWGAIGIIRKASSDGELLSETSMLFEYNFYNPKGRRPSYIGDPLTNNGYPVEGSRFLKTIIEDEVQFIFDDSDIPGLSVDEKNKLTHDDDSDF